MDAVVTYAIEVPVAQAPEFSALLTAALSEGLALKVTGIGIPFEDDDDLLNSDQEMAFERQILEEGR